MNKIKNIGFYGFIFIFCVWVGWFSGFLEDRFTKAIESVQLVSPYITEEVFVVDAVITNDNTYKTYLQFQNKIVILEDELAYNQLFSLIHKTVKISYVVENNNYVFKGIYI